MPTVAKQGKRERRRKSWVWTLGDNIRSRLTWLDLLVGLSAAVVISVLLVGLRYRSIPDYKVGEISTQDVRAMQDLTYEDTEATAQKREAARAEALPVYDLETPLITNKENSISNVFAAARDLLAQKKIPAKGSLSRSREAEILKELAESSGEVLPQDILRLLLRQRFNESLENQMLKVLDTLLRDGVVAESEWAQFLKHQRAGRINIQDLSTRREPVATEAYAARNLATARENMRQFQLEFSALPAQERAALIQFLAGFLAPTLHYNEEATLRRREDAARQVPPVELHIKQGKTIVRTGEEVTSAMVTQLKALRELHKPTSLLGQVLGFFCIAAIFIYGLWRYFVHYQSRHRKIRNHCLLLLIIVVAVLIVMRVISALADMLSERIAIDTLGSPFLLDYAIPFAFGGILIALLVDNNLAILASITIATLGGLFYGDVYLAAYAFIGSLAGIYSVRQYKDRAAIQKAGLTIGMVNMLTIFSIDLLRQLPFTYSAAASKAGFALASGLLASALASMLLPPLESLFKITTDIRLLEMSNLNAPILRRLSVEAPGTYHHSLMVGTLAEQAAEAVGANPLLVRVGAYYHDLGKMLKPEYFVENQLYGMNKHENLSPSMSCLIIASHVKDGIEMAKEIGLAERIRDMIPQHHGTRLMTYFFKKAKESQDTKNPELEEVDFRYPGPKPQSKEAAIMMMADSIEAASRTLSNPSPAQIQGMIHRLVDAIVADDQLDECDITLRDIRLVKESFLKVLTGLHHRRIDYPGYDFNQGSKEADKISVPSSSAGQAGRL